MQHQPEDKSMRGTDDSGYLQQKKQCHYTHICLNLPLPKKRGKGQLKQQSRVKFVNLGNCLNCATKLPGSYFGRIRFQEKKKKK